MDPAGPPPPRPAAQRLAAFLAILKEQTAAASALLPYRLEKVGQEAPTPPATVIVMPGEGGE